MDIAFYDLGNVEKPLGKLHTKKGEPRLKKDEMIIQELNTVKCEIRLLLLPMVWSPLFSKPIMLNTAEGSLYRTSDRFIYLREPDHKKIMMNKRIGDDLATDLAFQAKVWQRREWKEGFIISQKEISNFIRRPGWGSIINVLSKGKRYRIILRSPMAGEL